MSNMYHLSLQNNNIIKKSYNEAPLLLDSNKKIQNNEMLNDNNTNNENNINN